MTRPSSYPLALVVATACLCAVSARARAEAAMGLVWDAPEACPSSADVATQLASAAPALAGDPSRWQVRGRIVRDAREFALTLSIVDGEATSERVLRDEACPVLTDAAVLIVALFVESAPPRPAPVVEPAAPAPPPRPPVDEAAILAELKRRYPTLRTTRAAPPTPAPRPDPSTWTLSASGALALGLLPATTPAGTVAAAWHQGTLALHLEGFATTTVEIRTPTLGAGRVDVALAGLAGRACWLADRSSFDVWICGGASVARLSGLGVDLPEARAGAVGRLDLRTALALEGPILTGFLDWRLLAEAGWAPARAGFAVDGLGNVFRPAPWGFLVAAGLAWRLP